MPTIDGRSSSARGPGLHASAEKPSIICIATHAYYNKVAQQKELKYATSFQRSEEYLDSLREEVSDVVFKGGIDNNTTPSYVFEELKGIYHSTEHPLINKGLLASTKREQYAGHTTPTVKPWPSDRPKSQSASRSFYRPNSTHNYLTKTIALGGSHDGFNPKHGTPTRAQLLRNRVRFTSAPDLTYSYIAQRRTDGKHDASVRKAKMAEEALQLKANKIEMDKTAGKYRTYMIGSQYNTAKWINSHVNFVHGMVAVKNKRPVSSYTSRAVSLDVDVKRRATSARAYSEHLRQQSANRQHLQHETANSDYLRHQTANGEQLRHEAANSEHLPHQSANNQHLQRQAVNSELLQHQTAIKEHLRHETGQSVERCGGNSDETIMKKPHPISRPSSGRRTPQRKVGQSIDTRAANLIPYTTPVNTPGPCHHLVSAITIKPAIETESLQDSEKLRKKLESAKQIKAKIIRNVMAAEGSQNTDSLDLARGPTPSLAISINEENTVSLSQRNATLMRETTTTKPVFLTNSAVEVDGQPMSSTAAIDTKATNQSTDYDISLNVDTQNSVTQLPTIEVTTPKAMDVSILHGNSRAASAKTHSVSVELPGVDNLSDTLSKSLEFTTEEVTDSADNVEGPVVTSYVEERALDHAEVKVVPALGEVAVPALGEVADNDMVNDSYAALHSSSSDVITTSVDLPLDIPVDPIREVSAAPDSLPDATD